METCRGGGFGLCSDEVKVVVGTLTLWRELPHRELGVLPVWYFDSGARSRCPRQAKVSLVQSVKTCLLLFIGGYIRTST